MDQNRSLLIALVACALCAGSGLVFAGGDADADAGAAEPAAAAASSQPGVPNPGVVVFLRHPRRVRGGDRQPHRVVQ